MERVVLDFVLPFDFTTLGVYPRTLFGLIEIILFPFFAFGVFSFSF